MRLSGLIVTASLCDQPNARVFDEQSALRVMALVPALALQICGGEVSGERLGKMLMLLLTYAVGSCVNFSEA